MCQPIFDFRPLKYQFWRLEIENFEKLSKNGQNRPKKSENLKYMASNSTNQTQTASTTMFLGNTPANKIWAFYLLWLVLCGQIGKKIWPPWKWPNDQSPLTSSMGDNSMRAHFSLLSTLFASFFMLVLLTLSKAAINGLMVLFLI